MSKTTVNKKIRKILSLPTLRDVALLRPFCTLKGLTVSAAVVAMIVCALPERGFTRLPPIDSRDPYLRTMLLAKLSYGYESSSNYMDDAEKNRDSLFFQTYDMSLTGNWWDPRFIIFDTNVTYTNTINTYTGGGENLFTHSWNYEFMSILLRKFRFPLTLLATRSTSESSSINSVKITRDTYRANWYLKFHLLPVTNLTATRTISYSETTSGTASDNYSIEMKKRIGRMDNRFYYDYSVNGDSNQKNIGYSNSTKLSSSTRLSASGAYHRIVSSAERNNSTATTATGTTSSNSESMGLSMGLSSSPSRFFSQEHSYNYFSADSGDAERTEGQVFNGAVYFSPDAAYNANVTMSLDEVQNDTLSSHLDDRNLNLGGVFGYNITSNLSFNQSLRYLLAETFEVDTVNKETSSESISTNSSISFNKNLSWSTFSSSYGLGGVRTQINPGNESIGITQNLSLGLGGIGEKFIVLNNTFSAARNDNITGDIWSSSESYSASASNSLWKEYLNTTADARHSRSRDYLTIRDRTSTSYSLNLSSNYLYSTSISASLGYSDSNAGIEGNNIQEVYSLGLSRGQRVFHGFLNLNGAYTLQQSTSNKGATEERMNYNIMVRYTRPLMWNINWVSTGSFLHVETTTNEITASRESLGLTNSFVYSLRAWSISMRHHYRKLESSTNLNQNESEFVIRATRIIRRIF